MSKNNSIIFGEARDIVEQTKNPSLIQRRIGNSSSKTTKKGKSNVNKKPVNVHNKNNLTR